MSSAYEHWCQALNVFGLDSSIGEAAYQGLLKRYRENGRHYHTLSHIEALLNWSESYRKELAEPAVVNLAIWYHDAIYSSLRKDNESRSAALALKQLAAIGVPEAALHKISQLILQTAKHHGALLLKDSDLLWFLDFDLSILGSEPQVYQRYAQKIRQEYRLVPDILYRRGRSEVLRSMLQSEYLYYTPAFRRTHERNARNNLLNELRQWKAFEAMGLD